MPLYGGESPFVAAGAVGCGLYVDIEHSPLPPGGGGPRTDLWAPRALAPNISVIGQGATGAKAGELLRRNDILARIGFARPQRIVIANDVLDRFVSQAGLGESLATNAHDSSFAEKFHGVSLTPEMREVLTAILAQHGKVPLVVRSSAEGDARGHGNYVSAFANGDLESLQEKFLEVLAGYFSEDAVSFRCELKLGTDFGIIIEPVVSDDNDDLFAPLLSGFGYTSRNGRPAEINVVPGLGGGVEGRHGLKIRREDVDLYEGDLFSFLDLKRYDLAEGHPDTPMPALIAALDLNNKDDSVRSFSTQLGDIYYGRWSRSLYVLSQNKLNILPFLDMLQSLENECGAAQYVEWAMTMANGKPVFWILQIADAKHVPETEIDFSKLGTPLLEGEGLIGSGEVTCRDVVFCRDPGDVTWLRSFNRDHNNYVVVYSGALIGSMYDGSRSQLQKADVSNAKVCIELKDWKHVHGSIVDHWGGNAELRGKILGAVENMSFDDIAAGLTCLTHEPRSLPTFRGPVRVIASAEQYRLVILPPQI